MYWNHQDNYVENGKSENSFAPIPWDENYNIFFRLFLLKLKVIIDNSEHNINAIEITGGSNTNGIETNFVCSDKELERIQFTYSKYSNNWKKIIDNFTELFPKKILTLAIHDTFGSKRSNMVAKELIEYCNLKYADKIKIAAYAFTEEDWFNKGNQYANLVLELPSQDIVLQSIKIYSTKDNQTKFDKMLIKAISINPVWLEIWGEDILKGFLN
ncbi:hypothetical protein [uncultured Flavobacterium sp.]|uniref:hypothetical protein n=1 Tax=uncultured Flavobacterium sp. TaxID=165435 RepID=UPI00292E5E9E|nr:hypothetical protein [uncultured Flavobacterium sp.]